jgi:molybdenum cofactor biosynthesis enzyme
MRCRGRDHGNGKTTARTGVEMGLCRLRVALTVYDMVKAAERRCASATFASLKRGGRSGDVVNE